MIELPFFWTLVLLSILGIVAWKGTEKIYDWVSTKIFPPLEVETKEKKEKQEIYRSPNYIDSSNQNYETTVIRGGRGNAKLMEFVTPVDIFYSDNPPRGHEGKEGDLWIKKN